MTIRRFRSLFILGLGLLLFACNPQSTVFPITEEDPVSDTKIPKLGLSLVETSNPWRTVQINSFKEIARSGSVELVYYEPDEYTVEWQVQNLRKLIDEGVDYLVVVPHETAPLQEMLELARERKIPVILIEQNRESIPRELFATLISTDYIREGEICAQMLVEKYGDRPCNIVEIFGTLNSPVTKGRSEGFHRVLDKYPNLKIIASEYGNFDRVTAQKAMEKILVQALDQGKTIDAVFAHSDEDGLGALQALKVAGQPVGTDISIVSINGVQDVCKAIIAGEYLGTVKSNPRWGQIVLTLVQMMERGTKPFPMVIIPYRIINADNAEERFPTAY
ncbi:MAG: ABC transporter substrate-binding protein [Flexilinea sp.]